MKVSHQFCLDGLHGYSDSILLEGPEYNNKGTEHRWHVFPTHPLTHKITKPGSALGANEEYNFSTAQQVDE